MEEPSTKEAYRIFYLTKGHLECTPKVAKECYAGYFKRLWGVVENTAELDAEFEIAYAKKFKEETCQTETIFVQHPGAVSPLIQTDKVKSVA